MDNPRDPTSPASARAEPDGLSLTELLTAALSRRRPLIDQLEAEACDCYRVFHGTAEGWPGLSIDRYGDYLLAQTWGDPLDAPALAAIETLLGARFDLPLIWNPRGSGAGPGSPLPSGLPELPIGEELGLRYGLPPRHRGQDPLLFLDLRAARRRVLAESAGLEVLNLFAYSCGIGLCAAKGGASAVWNVDFAASALEVGRQNAERNGLNEPSTRYLNEDVLPALRQLAGLSVPLRRGKHPRYLRLRPRQFDLVVLDPPTWSTGPFGAVDIVRDYAGLFKPALLATRPGGRVLATNHAAQVAREDWWAILERCAVKAGRPLRDLEPIEPEADFPSLDGAPPLKMVLATVG
ncbi:MAG: class I SAM-dependent methyltransferase [Caldilineae bacterium]|nr:class I SAM-dependent methyltransferase [Chloroflexota bacterium]MCB9177498.1 class I SAM-dependent methyltransferase [Caldilineae bacterium]